MYGQSSEQEGYARLLAIANRQNGDVFDSVMFGAVADRLADKFGATGLPITLSTACASGATAIQLGVEAIRRGESDRALSIGADGSATAEALIRFSLLSALSTNNEVPEKASKPFSKDRDGFVLAEGSAALVLESLESAVARGATVLGVLAGCGERADDFHRTRSKPDGSPAIAAVRAALADSGLGEDGIGYVNAHGTSTPENDKMEHLSLSTVFGERMRKIPDLVQQVDDRPHPFSRRCDRGGVLADDDARGGHPSDHQLRQSRSGDRARCGAERQAFGQRRGRAFQLLRLRRPEHLPCHGPGTGLSGATRYLPQDRI